MWFNVSGLVYEIISGDPIAGAEVTVTDKAQTRSAKATASSSGEFTVAFYHPYYSVDVIVTATAKNFKSASQEVSLPLAEWEKVYFGLSGEAEPPPPSNGGNGEVTPPGEGNNKIVWAIGLFAIAVVIFILASGEK